MKKFTDHAVEESKTLLMNSLAQQKEKSGIRVFNVSAGEPKVELSRTINAAVEKALKKANAHRYPPAAGIPELREGAAQWMREEYGGEVSAKETLVVNGGKFGIFLLLQALLEKGDEVLIPSPYWVSYPTLVKLFKGRPVFIKTSEESEWKITAEQLEDACTAKTKMLILNSGSNPTGAVYSKKELLDILRVCKKKKLLVLSDEVYSGLTYDHHPYASVAAFPEFRDRVVVIQSISKHFAMTGWRVGFVFGPAALIANLSSLISQSTTGVPPASQAAALAAFQNPVHGKRVQREMQRRRDFFLKEFQKCFGVSLSKPAGGLYLFVSLQTLGVKTKDSLRFCREALEEANVALVPGKAFGKEGYVRFSFGASVEDIREGLRALRKFIAL